MDNEIEMLIKAFAADIPQRQGEVHQALKKLEKSWKAGQSVDWSELEYLTHKFAGSSGTYGFLPLSAVCRYCEELCLDDAFKALPAGLAGEHLARWKTVFDEQCALAAARRMPVETPEQLEAALGHHRASVTARRVA